MNRKRIATIALIVLVLGVITGAVLWQRRGAQATHAHDEAIYYCPMHPSVTSDKPGNCPICGMKLVKRSGSTQADSTPIRRPSWSGDSWRLAPPA